MKQIQLTQGQIAIVDDEDFEYLNQFHWFARWDKTNETYYASRTPLVNGKRTTINMHREIMHASKGEIVDHKNGDTLLNTKDNLRIVSNSSNCKNGKLRKNNKLGITGVHYYKNKWVAKVSANGKCIILGKFDNLFDAACARKSAEIIHGYDPSHGRIIKNERIAVRSYSRVPKNNSSGYKGISFHKQTGKWRSRIHDNKKEIYLGVFDNMEDAIKARKEAELIYLS